MAAKFLTVVIFARLFSTEVFGELALLLALVGLSAQLGAMGLPQSAVRFYWEFKKRGSESEYYRSLLWPLLIFVAAVSGLEILGFSSVAEFWFKYPAERLMAPLAILFVLGPLNEVLLGIQRAREAVSVFNAAVSIRNCGGVLAAILIVWSSELTLDGFLFGFCVGEALTLAFLASKLGKDRRFTLSLVPPSRNTTADFLRFGTPHLAVIVLGLLLSVSDRYIIAGFMGPSDVAIYTVAYSVMVALVSSVVTPLNLYVFPAYTKRWELQGKPATEEFLNNLIHIYLVAVCVIGALLFHLREPILQLVGGPEYLAGANVVVWVFAGLALQGLVTLTVAGLYLTKRTLVVAKISALAWVFNLAGNMIAVPRYGILGAAVITFLTYLLHTSWIWLLSRQHLHLKLDFKKILYFLLWLLPPGIILSTIQVNVFLLVLLVSIYGLYAALLFLQQFRLIFGTGHFQH